MNSTLYYLHALSPLHAGTGQGAGVIDLPIAREKATCLPFVSGSTVKGVLREEMYPEDDLDRPMWEALFGPERVLDHNGFAGAIAVGDAHLLCFPVRSLAGTFAWATCPFVLMRYTRESAAVGVTSPGLPATTFENGALTTTGSKIARNDTVVLEDLDLPARSGADEWAEHIAGAVFTGDAAWMALFKERFVILPDGIFDFLAETATEVRARIRIDPETRVVAKGMLWYEENLPMETLLYGAVAAGRARNGQGSSDEMLAKLIAAARLQLGGKATVGRGLVNWIKKEV